MHSITQPKSELQQKCAHLILSKDSKIRVREVNIINNNICKLKIDKSPLMKVHSFSIVRCFLLKNSSALIRMK